VWPDDDVARRAIEKHGTPLYLHDLGRVRRQIELLRRALPDFVDILYAVKANPHPALVRTCVAAGTGLEVASAAELELALSCDVARRRIAFAGPAKRDVELRAVLEAGSVLNVESEGELERAAVIAGELDGPRAVSVRVSPPWSVGESVSIIGGAGPSKFGVDLDRLDRFIDRTRSLESLRLTGLHVFNASNVLDAAALVAGWERILELGRRLADAGVDLEVVDLGGGLGVPYGAGQTPLDVEALGAGLDAAYARVFGDHGPRIIIEPGRFVMAEAGWFLTRVIDRKTSRGTEFVLCDGGINHLLRPALIGQPHPMSILGRPTSASAEMYAVGGPLCTSLDLLARETPLPDPQPGDVVVVACAGAYGFTESMLDFLSHPRPAQVMIDAGQEVDP